uniref:Uncharacterized protein n=1 Tax=viral metagenome TaxID=1070528 RepID=A0A6C0CYY6_9ZZZZ
MYNPIVTSLFVGGICVILSEIYYKTKYNVEDENDNKYINDNKVNNQLIIFIGLFTICYMYICCINNVCVVDTNDNIEIEPLGVEESVIENIEPTKVPF